MSQSNTEIERKFLALSMPDVADCVPFLIRQAYIKLPTDGVSEVRVRHTTRQVFDNTFEEKAYITVKSCGAIERVEVEQEISIQQALALFELCTGCVIEKARYPIVVPHEGRDFVFEVDVYTGAHEGLITVDVELPDRDTVFPKPEWLGAEISHDIRYSNSDLARTGALAKGFSRKQ